VYVNYFTRINIKHNNHIINNTFLYYDPTTHILIIYSINLKIYYAYIFSLALKKIEMDNLGPKIVKCTGPTNW